MVYSSSLDPQTYKQASTSRKKAITIYSLATIGMKCKHYCSEYDISSHQSQMASLKSDIRCRFHDSSQHFANQASRHIGGTEDISATILTCTYMHVCLLDRRMHQCSSQASRHCWCLLTAFLAPEKESKQRILYHNMTPDHILVTLNQKVYPHHHKIVPDHHKEAKCY